MGYLFKAVVLILQTLTFKYKKMKNSFKLGFVALVIAVSAAACGGDKKTGTSDTTVKVDSTVKKDSVVKVDSTAKKDTTKKDTTKK
jgi:ABC-type glycerol-3-phosphate transport system substrate-binding protein